MKLFRGIISVPAQSYPLIESILKRDNSIFTSTVRKQAEGYNDKGIYQIIPDSHTMVHWCDGVVDVINDLEQWLKYKIDWDTSLLRDIQGDIAILERYISYSNKEAISLVHRYRRARLFYEVPFALFDEYDHMGEVWFDKNTLYERVPLSP